MRNLARRPASGVPRLRVCSVRRMPDHGQLARTKCGQAGQSLIESLVVIILISLIFTAMLQISQLFAAREVLSHAAARGARAKTVGFNRWMVEKVVRVASIPNAGRMTEPPFQDPDRTLQDFMATLRPGEMWTRVLGIVPSSMQYELERVRIPEYLASRDWPEADATLDYEHWNDIHAHVGAQLVSDTNGVISLIHVRVSQDYPLNIPMHNLFYARDRIDLEGESYLENHYPLYIDDLSL